MMTLTRNRWPRVHYNYNAKMTLCRSIAESALQDSGLAASLKASHNWHGFVTIEDAPVNSYGQHLVKAVYYEHDTHTRHGYHAKYKVSPTGELIEL